MQTPIIKNIRFVHVFSGTSLVLSFTWFFCYALVLSHEQRADSKEINMAIITFLVGIGAYWVGSSNSSAKKDATIAEMGSTPSPVTVRQATNVNAAPADTQGEQQTQTQENNQGAQGTS